VRIAVDARRIFAAEQLAHCREQPGVQEGGDIGQQVGVVGHADLDPQIHAGRGGGQLGLHLGDDEGVVVADEEGLAVAGGVRRRRGDGDLRRADQPAEPLGQVGRVADGDAHFLQGAQRPGAVAALGGGGQGRQQHDNQDGQGAARCCCYPVHRTCSTLNHSL